MTPLSGPILTAAEMRAAELACGVPLAELMERAGAALADAVVRFAAGRSVIVLCGPGNNGGDGYVAARRLAARGVAVQLAARENPQSHLAKVARERWSGPVATFDSARPAQVVVDALFGTGLTRPLEDRDRGILSKLRTSAELVIAADIPSGVDSDAGTDLGAVASDLTLAFGAVKPGHVLQPGAAKCGHVMLAEIGIGTAGDAHVLTRPRLAPPSATDYKYTRGMVAVVPGEMAGAAALGVAAAAHVAGYTILCGKGDAPAAIVRRGFEATLGDAHLDAMLIGPGLSDTPGNRAKLDAALASSVGLVLDAGALGVLRLEQLRRGTATIITPHEGEFVRLFGRIEGSKIERARVAAARSGVVVVLKGSDTVIAAPDGRAIVSPMASPWLATAGTGDVLAGLATGLLARLREPFAAAAAAVWLHGEAARCAGSGFIADELIAHIPAAVDRASR